MAKYRCIFTKYRIHVYLYIHTVFPVIFHVFLEMENQNPSCIVLIPEYSVSSFEFVNAALNHLLIHCSLCFEKLVTKLLLVNNYFK